MPCAPAELTMPGSKRLSWNSRRMKNGAGRPLRCAACVRVSQTSFSERSITGLAIGGNGMPAGSPLLTTCAEGTGGSMARSNERSATSLSTRLAEMFSAGLGAGLGGSSMAEALLSTGAVRVSTLRLAASEPVNSSSDNLESVLPIALDQVARHTHAGRKSCRISSHPLHQCRLGPQKAEARLCGANKTNFGCVN